MSLKNLVAGVLAIATAVSATPSFASSYLPVGPQLNVPLSTVTGGGWSLCYEAPMATFLGNSAAATINTSCTSGSNILLAGRATGSDTLLALAETTRTDAFFDTGINDSVTHLSNGSEWYNSDNYSWGFAPAGESVSKGECDTNEGLGRICLHTINNAGGYRINDLFGLNNSTAYEKLVFEQSPGSVPEPTNWAMMLVGFAMLGAVLRRAKRAVSLA